MIIETYEAAQVFYNSVDFIIWMHNLRGSMALSFMAFIVLAFSSWFIGAILANTIFSGNESLSHIVYDSCFNFALYSFITGLAVIFLGGPLFSFLFIICNIPG